MSSKAGDGDECADFSQVTAVATGWMLDFSFVRLCRHFKEGNLEEFKETMVTVEAISLSPSLKGNLHNEKVMICAFLARVMHGKQLDVLFEEDDKIMPLMSAATIWTNLKDAVADESLFKNITILLLVQAVAVCLEKGQKSSASSVLKWFETNHEFPQNLRNKLSTIMTQRDNYHPFIMSFSFSRLLETVQLFLDAYLEKNPSDYLLKAATKTIQSSESLETLKDITEDSRESQTVKESTKNALGKRKLLCTRMSEMSTPESCKKLHVGLKGISKTGLSKMTSQQVTNISNRRRQKKKWTEKLDKYLKLGVERHGVGKWSRILMDYDFEGRTGTMLKDRWRILLNAHAVG